MALSTVTLLGADWERAAPEALNMDGAKLLQARDYALAGEGSGLIVRQGKVVLSWGDLKARYDLKSTTKSFGAAAFGLALLDGKLRLEDRAVKFHSAFGAPPETNRATGWVEQITMLHLLTQTAGFEKPGGFTRLLFPPGTKWDYSDSGPNWLAECITLVYRRDLDAMMFDRVFAPIGISREDLVWRKNQYRPDLIEGIKRREFGAGISANVDAMARFGYLHLRKGEWKGKRVLSAAYVELVSKPHPNSAGLSVLNTKDYGNASRHYGLLWWNNADGTLGDVPRDAFWSWGLYDSLIVVIPSLELVIARAGKSWKRAAGSEHYDVLKPFLGPICASIQSIVWAPVETIIRQARGGDNWPMTWGDDDALYTAYGDGRGFEPFIPEKLSLGLAKVHGSPPNFRGENIPAPTLEQKGEGERGRKASGMLMVEGVLYLLVRNATNSQIAWSSDRGQTWLWCVWKFTESFGCPTFLNFGPNYSGARDSFVYVFSPDSDSAYTAADRMVLARVPAKRIREREAYEFFVRLEDSGPAWSEDIRERGTVFESAGKCYRSGVSYHAASRRYLWCQILPGKDPRFAGGFAVRTAAEPWGPWTTTFYTENWDVGPGETCSFPTKWMESDGTNLHMVFSGDDYFSVRRATLHWTEHHIKKD